VLAPERGAGLALTATFKHQKGGLQVDGWDLARAGPDELWLRDDAARTFVRLTAQLARDIESGAVRL
jgi:hypothetical protein